MALTYFKFAKKAKPITFVYVSVYFLCSYVVFIMSIVYKVVDQFELEAYLELYNEEGRNNSD